MSAFKKVATQGKLTLGLVFPLEGYSGAIPTMKNQEALAALAEDIGFSALWFRDVPFNDPNFGDAGQMFDPWIYMTHIMNHTKSIALASGSIILPLRHPVHVAKSIQSLQYLSNNRLVLGVASGDRPIEYPAFNQDLSKKGELFRDSFGYVKALLEDNPMHTSKHYGSVNGMIDVLPKAEVKPPFLITGHSGQSLEWIAENGDGWLYYPRDMRTLQMSMNNWTQALKETNQPWKPYMQSLYIDLVEDDTAHPSPIHLGFRTGSKYLVAHLQMLEDLGVNHVILNLKYSTRPVKQVLEELGKKVLSKVGM